MDGRVVAIGDPLTVGPFALCGVHVIGVVEADAALQAWDALDDDVTMVIADGTVMRVLEKARDRHPHVLVAELP